MTEQRIFDPSAPLPDAPSPWAASSLPAVRSGPPFLLTEMIEAEPAIARRLLARLPTDSELHAVAEAIKAAIRDGEPIVVTGCGTSDHAARAAAAILVEALQLSGTPGQVVARQALEVAMDPPRGGVLLAISHEGATWATNRAIEAARAAGAVTALITVTTRSPGAALADMVIATGELDQSWCHTVAYLVPILVSTAVAADLSGGRVDVDGVARSLEAGGAAGPAAERVAAALTDVSQVLVVASGVDSVSAAELALKIEEGAHLPATLRDLESLLHGHLAATGPSTGLVLILADPLGRSERIARARDVLAAAAAIGMPAAGILTADASDDLDASLMPAGRIACPEPPGVGARASALLGAALPLQLLAERLSRARGRNPDVIRRDERAYADAAARAERS